MDRHPIINTQAALESKSGVAQSYLSRILRGESAATVDRLEKIAGAFGCEPWELLVESEKIRRLAIERILQGPAVPDEEVEKALGLPEPKEKKRATKNTRV